MSKRERTAIRLIFSMIDKDILGEAVALAEVKCVNDISVCQTEAARNAAEKLREELTWVVSDYGIAPKSADESKIVVGRGVKRWD